MSSSVSVTGLLVIFQLIAGSSSLPSLSAQSSLSGVVRDSVRGSPVANTQILLTRDTLPDWDRAHPSRLLTLAGPNGEFRFPDLPPGDYVLHARFIGYRARWLPVSIHLGPSQFIVVRLSSTDLCLGSCGPDPVKLAYAREHRSEWGCVTEQPKEIESVRQGWVKNLLEYPLSLPDSAGALPPLPRDSARLDGLLRHVTDRKRCRRAGQVYDKEYGATNTRFLVYEAGPVLFVSDSWGGDGTLVLDRNYRVLVRFIVE